MVAPPSAAARPGPRLTATVVYSPGSTDPGARRARPHQLRRDVRGLAPTAVAVEVDPVTGQRRRCSTPCWSSDCGRRHQPRRSSRASTRAGSRQGLGAVLTERARPTPTTARRWCSTLGRLRPAHRGRGAGAAGRPPPDAVAAAGRLPGRRRGVDHRRRPPRWRARWPTPWPRSACASRRRACTRPTSGPSSGRPATSPTWSRSPGGDRARHAGLALCTGRIDRPDARDRR